MEARRDGYSVACPYSKHRPAKNEMFACLVYLRHTDHNHKEPANQLPACGRCRGGRMDAPSLAPSQCLPSRSPVLTPERRGNRFFYIVLHLDVLCVESIDGLLLPFKRTHEWRTPPENAAFQGGSGQMHRSKSNNGTFSCLYRFCHAHRRVAHSPMTVTWTVLLRARVVSKSMK